MQGYFVDTSVWVASSFEKHPHYRIADLFLRERSPEDPAWLARMVENSWLRLLTTTSVCRAYDAPASTNPQAVAILQDWRGSSEIRCLDAEPPSTRELWLELAAIPSSSPKVWMDAYLAALAICAGIPFATLDSDFRRFEAAGLKLRLLTA